MRYSALVTALCATASIPTFPALAWEATVGEICTLTHETADGAFALTYDPSGPLYSITVTRAADPWAPGPIFGLRFEGAQPNMISTSRHRLSEGNSALTVTDRGFGNVLDGLQFNDRATAFSGEQAVSVPLEGAAPEVAKFRACAEAGLV